MESLPANPILEFYPNQLKEVRKLFGYGDLNRLRQDIDILREWIKKQEHFVVKEYDEAYLERQLIFSKGSIEKAKKRIDKLCTLRGLMPEYLQGYDIENEFKNTLEVSHAAWLPKTTPDYYRMIYYDFYNPDTTKYEQKDIARYLLLLVQYLMSHDYCAGIIMISDISNISFGIMSKLSPLVIGNTLTIIVEAIGLRLKGLHFIHRGSKFLETVVAIVKRGLSTKLMSRLHVHESFETLFEYIPKNVIPIDVGGDLPITLNEICENNIKEFSSAEFIQKMKLIEREVTDESKRLTIKFNEDYCGMPGSFKVLSVD